MDPRPPGLPRPQSDRRRSRSPSASGNQDESRRTRDPPPPASLQELRDRHTRQFIERFLEQEAAKKAARKAEKERRKKVGEQVAGELANILAESERRKNLEPLERLREDGLELRDEILSGQGMSATFEMSRSTRARCRAKDDCVYVKERIPTGDLIQTSYRIRVDGVVDPMFWRPTTYFYHVECFAMMVPVEDLLPTKFQLEPTRNWSLLIRKWFEHKGCIDLNKLAAYIKEFKAYSEKLSAFEAARDNCQERDHEAPCACPPKPEKPFLKDYITGEKERCGLWELLEHPNLYDLPVEVWCIDGRVQKTYPETEGQSEQASSSEATSSHGNEETKGVTGV